jgi:hypothetical protein
MTALAETIERLRRPGGRTVVRLALPYGHQLNLGAAFRGQGFDVVEWSGIGSSDPANSLYRAIMEQLQLEVFSYPSVNAVASELQVMARERPIPVALLLRDWREFKRLQPKLWTSALRMFAEHGDDWALQGSVFRVVLLEDELGESTTHL